MKIKKELLGDIESNGIKLKRTKVYVVINGEELFRYVDTPYIDGAAKGHAAHVEWGEKHLRRDMKEHVSMVT